MPGEPSYVELGVPDVDAARRFYGSLLGWTPNSVGTGGEVETRTMRIGMHGGDPEAHFELFFTVDDLNASAAQVIELGGSVLSDAGPERPGPASDGRVRMNQLARA